MIDKFSWSKLQCVFEPFYNFIMLQMADKRNNTTSIWSHSSDISTYIILYELSWSFCLILLWHVWVLKAVLCHHPLLLLHSRESDSKTSNRIMTKNKPARLPFQEDFFAKHFTKDCRHWLHGNSAISNDRVRCSSKCRLICYFNAIDR